MRDRDSTYMHADISETEYWHDVVFCFCGENTAIARRLAKQEKQARLTSFAAVDDKNQQLIQTERRDTSKKLALLTGANTYQTRPARPWESLRAVNGTGEAVALQVHNEPWSTLDL